MRQSKCWALCKQKPGWLFLVQHPRTHQRAGFELGNQSRLQDQFAWTHPVVRRTRRGRPSPLLVCQTGFDAAVVSALARFQRAGSERRWGGFFFTVWPTQLTGSLTSANHSRAERINQELLQTLCLMLQPEAAIDYACDQDRVLREPFHQVARSQREEVLPPDLEVIRTETTGFG